MAANSKDQVKLSGWPLCSGFAKSLDPKGKVLKCYRDSITLNKTNSVLKVIASDDSKLDGFNASFALLDEFHGAKDSRVRDVIRSSMSMRTNPHLCIITTAGLNKQCPCYTMREVSCEVLNGSKTNDALFIAIYSLDESDDWKDERNWVKCTPNLNITVQLKNILEDLQGAINNSAEEFGFKTKTLNIWMDRGVAEWLSDELITNNSKKLILDEFKDCDCYVGVDLASVSDFTAVSYLFIKDNIKHFITDYYLPESALIDGINKDKYLLWSKQGYLKITSGNVTDYSVITQDIINNTQHTYLNGVFYDKFNATQWAIEATDACLPLEEFAQSLANFNKPTKEFERLIKTGNVILDFNPVTNFCFDNVVLKFDHNNNCKPDKAKRSNKIDGTIAILQALGGYLDNPNYNINYVQ